MSRFKISELSAVGLKCVTRHCIEDTRGYLARVFCAEELALAGWLKPIVQISHTYTVKRGTVRGLHYQTSPNAEMKLVNCICGEVFDVAVDLRANSATFLHWHAEILSADNGRALLIPEGFAHGFQALTDDCEMLYLSTAVHDPNSENGLRFDDPRLGISWPLSAVELSARDVEHPLITSKFKGMDIE